MTYAPPPPPPMQHRSPNPWFRRTWAIVAIALVAFFVGIGAGAATNTTNTAASAPTVTTTAPAPAPSTVTHHAPAPPAKTRTLKPTVIKTVATRTHTMTVTFTPKPKPAINDGVYQVGRDINPGTWRTQGGNDCYFEIDNDANGNNIANNGDSTGPQIAQVSTGQYLQLSGGCDWRHD